MPEDAAPRDERDDLVARHLSRLDEHSQEATSRRRRRGVQFGTALMAAVVGLAALDGIGAVDAVGPDTAEAVDVAGDVQLVVRYATVSRPALATPLEIEITQAGGFGGQQVEVAISTDYLLLFDLNGILPAPAEETADAETLHWTFDPPDGDTLRIVYEARVEPAAQAGRSGRVAVLDDRGDELVAVGITTELRP